MKIKITVEGDQFEDKDELETFMNATNMSIVINEFYEYLRRNDKHNDSETVKWEDVRERFWDVCVENGVKII